MADQMDVLMGEVKLGFEDSKLTTLGLGSCIGLVLYDPSKKIAIMGHIMMPDSNLSTIKNENDKKVIIAIKKPEMSSIVTQVLNENNISYSNYINSIPENINLMITEKEIFSSIEIKNNINLLLMLSSYDKEYISQIIIDENKEIIIPPYIKERIKKIIDINLNRNSLKYANVMIPYMIEKLEMFGCNKNNLVAKMAGGAQMFATIDTIDIGKQNKIAIKNILSEKNIKIISEDVGGNYGRTVTFDTNTNMLNIKTKDNITQI